ncbi:MAG: DeoR/GlpR family DNA-binding transcription regulator, partial [Anaerolineae bacterium]|nr:DeoR/GlpR family DNA-binding transcription regulator [Anaerolineae bacterium]
MNAFERRNAIRELVAKNGMMAVRALSEALSVSEVSVRRDLAILEQQGFLVRVHGGAVFGDGGLGGRPYALKVQLHADEKRRIGQKAATLIQPGDHVILDGGSTVMEVARCLRSDPMRPERKITVLARSLPMIDLLGHRPGLDVIALGGLFLPRFEMMGGSLARKFLQGLNAEKLFLGIDALTVEGGLMTDDASEADLLRAMADASQQVILVADSSKIGQRGFVTALPINRIHVFVTDAGAPEGFVKQVREMGI